MIDSSSNQPVLQKQSTLNRSTRGQWNLYTSHRQELERLLVPQQPGGRICVVGAGNCNDLDLNWLTTVYRQVHLVDIDPEAMARGMTFQKMSPSEKVSLHGGVDLTGLAGTIGNWHKKKPTDEEIAGATRIAATGPQELADMLGGPFDVVLSPCVLSQLLTPVRDAISEDHPGFMPLLAAMRRWHFQLMLQLLAPGGRGVLACDLLSSKSFPDLARVTHDRLPDLMRTMLEKGRCFSGLEPASITSALKRDPIVAPYVGELRLAAPWLWHLGLSKCYLVYGVTFSKRGQIRRP